jgi:tetratricopeptide (TPR) repeat protein
MRTCYIIIGTAVVVIVLLGTFTVLQDSQLTSEQARNAELRKKVESLEQEVAALKETPDRYFQRGVDLQYAGNYPEAKEAFQAVIDKFPESKLAAKAQERIIYLNGAIAQSGAQAAGGTGKTVKGKR